MGTSSRVWVKVLRSREEWIELNVPSWEAKEHAAREPGVIAVLDVQYEKPEELKSQ